MLRSTGPSGTVALYTNVALLKKPCAKHFIQIIITGGFEDKDQGVWGLKSGRRITGKAPVADDWRIALGIEGYGVPVPRQVILVRKEHNL